MVAPDMATMLCFLFTDAALPAAILQPMLSAGVEASFNRITIDSDTSTSDTVLLFATGAAGNDAGADTGEFRRALHEVLLDLALLVVRDGEGAQKFITITVEGAVSDASAKRIGLAIANSPLVKTAIAGSDANWGRIICAAGYSGADFDPAAVDIVLQGVRVCRAGLAARFDEAALKKKLDESECSVGFRIAGTGKGTARFYTCDLTHGYIDINASYRT
jgi:glutamate N-acetyltransferase/amino-acid N-acetyltransferase